MKFLINALMFLVCIFPKINIIGVSSSKTGIRLEDLLIAFLCFLLILYFIKHRKFDFPKKLTKIFKIFSVYFIFSFISTLIGIFFGYVSTLVAFLYLARKIEYFIFIYFGYLYSKDNHFEKYFDLIIIFHFGCSLLQQFGLIGSFNHGEMLTSLTQGRVSSTFNGAYELSAFLLIILPYYLEKLYYQKGNKLKNIFFILIITYCIYISKSRTSLIVEFVLILFMLFQSPVIRNKKAIFRFVIVFACAFPFMHFNLNRLDFSRFESLNAEKVSYLINFTWKYKSFDRYVETRNWYGNAPFSLNEIAALGYDGSLYQRLSHWMQLIDGFLRSPIFGLGLSISGGSADGNYIRILSESGIIGLILWLYLIFVCYRDLKHSSKFSYLKYALLSIILGSIFIDLFDSSKIMMFFWFLYGISIGKEEYSND